MAPRRPVPAPIKCGALARHTGQPCRRWAVPGALRCPNHGGLSHPGGRAAAEELHTARRIEATVTAAVARQLTGAAPSPELLAGLTAEPPRVPASRPPTDDAIDESAINASMARMADEFVRRFAELVGARGDREEVPPPAEPVQEPAEPDPVAERIEALEARPTARRMTEAARLRQPREHQDHALTLHGQAAEPEPEPPAAAPPPEPVKPGRRTTTLGSRPGGQINTGGNLR